MSLQEDLDELSRTLPAIVQEATDAKEELKFVSDALSRLVSATEPLELGLRNRVGVTATQASHLAALVDGLQKELETALTELEKGWTTAHASQDTAEAHLVAAADAVAPARHTLQTALVSAAERIEHASADGPAVLEALHGAGEAGHDEITNGVHRLRDHTASVHELLETTRDQAALKTRPVIDPAVSLGHDLTGEVQAFEQAMGQAGVELVSHDEQVHNTLVEHLQQLIEDACRHRIEQAILPHVREGADHAQAALDALARGAAETATGVETASESLMDEIARLDALAGPLGASMDQIHQAAAKLHQP